MELEKIFTIEQTPVVVNGNTLFVRCPSIADVRAATINTNGSSDSDLAAVVRLVVRCTVDEGGERVFSDDQYEPLMDMPHRQLMPLIEAVSAAAGVELGEDDDLPGKSKGTVPRG